MKNFNKNLLVAIYCAVPQVELRLSLLADILTVQAVGGPMSRVGATLHLLAILVNGVKLGLRRCAEIIVVILVVTLLIKVRQVTQIDA